MEINMNEKMAERRVAIAKAALHAVLAEAAKKKGLPYNGDGSFEDALSHREWFKTSSADKEADDLLPKAEYIPLSVMRQIYVLLTFGYGREEGVESVFHSVGNNDGFVEYTARLSDGFGGVTTGTVTRTYDHGSFASAGQKAAAMMNLARGSAWSAAYAAAGANLGIFPKYIEPAPEKKQAPAPAANNTAPAAMRMSEVVMSDPVPHLPASQTITGTDTEPSEEKFAAMADEIAAKTGTGKKTASSGTATPKKRGRKPKKQAEQTEETETSSPTPAPTPEPSPAPVPESSSASVPTPEAEVSEPTAPEVPEAPADPVQPTEPTEPTAEQQAVPFMDDEPVASAQQTASSMTLDEALDTPCKMAPGYTVGGVCGLRVCKGKKRMVNGESNAIRLLQCYANATGEDDMKQQAAVDVVVDYMCNDNPDFAAKVAKVRAEIADNRPAKEEA